MERQKLMLAALAAGGENATFAPVQVQKLFFLIDREASNLVGGPFFDFVPYDYGPFDKAVYIELDSLYSQELLQTRGISNYRTYALTPAGFAAGTSVLTTMSASAKKFLREAAQWVRSLNFQQLVAAIYNRYPDMRVNSIFRE